MARGVPEGFHTVTPALTVDGAAEAIALYERALGAEEISRAADPSGKKIWHAEVRIGDSRIFVNDAFPDQGATAMASKLWIYCEDVDTACKRAADAGLEVKMPPTDMFWGDRFCALSDRWGNQWFVATRKKTLSADEMAKAQAEAVAAWQDGKK
jgi:PhnB protein